MSSDATARSLLRYGWQAGCGLYACYGRPDGDGGVVAADVAASEADAESLVDRALANGDEHVIKFTEACLARHRIAPSPAYPAAVAHVLSDDRPPLRPAASRRGARRAGMRRLISPNHLLGAAAKLGYKRPAVGGSEDRAGGLSVNGFFSKVARLAVSKAAAFGYAVAVGVTGNIAFNYVQPHAPPATAAAVATQPAPEGGAAGWANPATTAPAATRTHAAPAATHAERPPAAPPRPAARHQTVASAPVLPEPPAAVALPGLDALPPPPFKPAALPSEAALRPSPVRPRPRLRPSLRLQVPAASRGRGEPSRGTRAGGPGRRHAAAARAGDRGGGAADAADGGRAGPAGPAGSRRGGRRQGAAAKEAAQRLRDQRSLAPRPGGRQGASLGRPTGAADRRRRPPAACSGRGAGGADLAAAGGERRRRVRA